MTEGYGGGVGRYPTPTRGSSSMNGGGGGGASGNGGNINNRWNADGGGGYNGGGGVGGGFDSSGSNEPHDEYEQLVHATRQTQSTSLHTTRRALEKLNNTELLARNNANQLQAQSEQLRRIDKKLDVTDHHVKASDAKADELKALKRFFFLPTFGASKRNAAKQEKLKREREDMERRDAEEEEARIQQQQQQQRRNPHAAPHGGGSSSYSNYSTPYGMQRDETEEEIDSNLDQISSGLARIRMMGQSMNAELSSQQGQMNRIYDKTAMSDERLGVANRKLNGIMGKK